MNINNEVSELLFTYNKYNKIIVGVDFDDTIFPYNKSKYNEDRCKRVREILVKLQDYIILCLFTVADEQSLVYKTEIMKLYGLDAKYINSSPIENWGKCRKPYFNILLDDKAGLNETINNLEELYKEIKIREINKTITNKTI